MIESGTVYVVDDDAAMRDLIEVTLKHAGLASRAHPSIDSFLQDIQGRDDHEAPACLLLDLVLPGISGLDFLEQRFRAGLPWPVIIITAKGSVRAAVRSLKMGAVDFLEKPFSPEELKTAVLEALQRHQQQLVQVREREELRNRLARLSRRERELLTAIVQGQSTKMIAETLGISARTVDHHRANLMDKMRATNVADLVRMAMQASSAESAASPSKA
jgi:two-component system response regulator FixJ